MNFIALYVMQEETTERDNEDEEVQYYTTYSLIYMPICSMIWFAGRIHSNNKQIFFNEG